MRIILWSVAFLLSTAAVAYAFDGQSPGPLREFRLGPAAHDVDGLWSGDSKEKGPDICAEAVFNRLLFTLLAASAYPNAGVSLNTRGDTSTLYGGFKLVWDPPSILLFSSGLGLAVHNGKCDTDLPDRKSLGARVLFRVPIEIGCNLTPRYRLWLVFNHISNAYLFSPNKGLDTLGVMVSYRF